MLNKQSITYILMALIIIWAFGYMAYGEDAIPSREELRLQARNDLMEEQARIDTHNLMVKLACREESEEKATKASEQIRLQSECFEKDKRPDIDIEKAMEKFSTWTLTTGQKTVVPSWSYQCSIGTGSHDVRQYAKFHPWIAWWRNNNVSGITMGSTELQNAFDKAWIEWEKGTLRPANEGNRYYAFPDLENGMRAKLLIIKRSYKDSTISQFLARWWTDSIPTTLDKNRKIGSLTDSELLSFLRLQIQKESWKAFADYVYNNVIICK